MDSSSAKKRSQQVQSPDINGQAAVLFLYAETPVHAGTGEASSGIDLPIQRSAQTGWPIIYDSTMRGGFRRMLDNPNALFGEDDSPGRLATPDAELLFFPIVSAKGLSAWIAALSPLRYFLRRLQNFEYYLSKAALEEVAKLEQILDKVGEGPRNGEAWISDSGCKVSFSAGDQSNGYLLLEGESFAASEKKEVAQLADWFSRNAIPFSRYWPERFKTHFALLAEPAFTHYVTRKTDVRTRVKIEKGTAANSGPWSEENLPVDSILSTVLVEPDLKRQDASREGTEEEKKNSESAIDQFRNAVQLRESYPVLQLGGDQNLGRGRFRIKELAVTPIPPSQSGEDEKSEEA